MATKRKQDNVDLDSEMARFEAELSGFLDDETGGGSSGEGAEGAEGAEQGRQAASSAASASPSTYAAAAAPSSSVIEAPAHYSAAPVQAQYSAEPAKYYSVPETASASLYEAYGYNPDPYSSNYVPPAAPGARPAAPSASVAIGVTPHPAAAAALPPGKKPKANREAGGEKWHDASLDNWDPNDFRIFIGDLGQEVGEDTIVRAFSRFPSLQRARVVRDKKSGKSRGYGFISFKDPQDFLKALTEMNGKYIGNRPCKLRKSTWQDREVEDKKHDGKQKKK